MLVKDIKFLISGVGGQGTVLASDILSDVGVFSGYDVKKSDILGLAVRGGAVVSHVRWAEKVHTPVLEEGSADYLVGFEWLETLRRVSYVKPGGTILVNDCRMDPISVSSGEAEYPDPETILALFKKSAANVVVIPGLKTALDLKEARILNIVMMGALAGLLKSDDKVWEEVVQKRVPKRFLNLNLKAYRQGRALVS
ncbi:MAG: 2-oxoacid:ferredoxin oxidoreductase, gamma subunit [Deltaproteobacteria bacterium]|nr:2-oxoacid:ferredoxin oxidoreductase, gamma subunit [Deltaproteobacteria bacterium]